MVGLRLDKEVGAQKVRCMSDFLVASKKINKVFQVNDPLLNYHHIFQKLKEEFDEVQVTHTN